MEQKQTIDDERWYSYKELGAFLGIHRNTLAAYKAQGRLAVPYQTIGTRTIRFRGDIVRKVVAGEIPVTKPVGSK